MWPTNPYPSLLPFFLLPLLSASSTEAAKPRDAILLSQVQSLTLRSDKQTSHRRVPAVPQLKCVSGRNLCSRYTIDTMRCENKGSGYGSEDIQWSCSASLPPELKLGSTDVICEGYAGPDDPYVLKGSCGVEYRLALTDKGEGPGGGKGRIPGGGGAGGEGTDWGGVVFGVIFFAVLIWIVSSACMAARRNNQLPRMPRVPRPNNNFWGGGGGGGGGDDGNDPPPPYPGTGGPRTYKTKPSTGSTAGPQQQQGWRPDMWSGLGGAAAGAAAGYFAGNRGNNNNNTQNRGRNDNYGGGRQDYGSSWGGGGGSSRSGSSGSSSGSAPSSSRYESTGFGGTSRR